MHRTLPTAIWISKISRGKTHGPPFLRESLCGGEGEMETEGRGGKGRGAADLTILHHLLEYFAPPLDRTVCRILYI